MIKAIEIGNMPDAHWEKHAEITHVCRPKAANINRLTTAIAATFN